MNIEFTFDGPFCKMKILIISPSTVLVVLILSVFLFNITAKPTPSVTASPTPTPISSPQNIAYCLTGQLGRLELISKLKNIITPNLQLGHSIHLFVLLDNRTDEVKQTFWKYDYSNSLYQDFDSQLMTSYIIGKLAKVPQAKTQFKVKVRLETPSQDEFQIVDGFVPVADKVVKTKHHDGGDNLKGIEPASVRFQNNMRWLGGLRECVRWMQHTEYEEKKFFDLVVRLRDDTFALGPWLLSKEVYSHALTSSSTGNFRGINDHNFVVDRQWADTLLRGFTEDYYFNNSLAGVSWGNPEHRIYMLCQVYGVPVQSVSLCEQPLVPVRGRQDTHHWLVHPSYTEPMLEACQSLENQARNDTQSCRCAKTWVNILKSGVVEVDP